MSDKTASAVQLATIIPGPVSEDGYHRTQGTKVLLPSGEELPRVTEIQLDAQVGDVWRAVITCMAHVEPISAAAEIRCAGTKLSWKERLLGRVCK